MFADVVIHLGAEEDDAILHQSGEDVPLNDLPVRHLLVNRGHARLVAEPALPCGVRMPDVGWYNIGLPKQ